MRREQGDQGPKRRIRWGILVGYLLVAAATLVACAPAQGPGATPASQSRIEDDPALGPAGAPVTIVEYGDFGCPSCRAWHAAGVLERIRDQYGDRVRFIWRDFPVITAQSPKAAEAAQCAYDQGRFWEYHDLLFARAPALAVTDLKAYAGELGLDHEPFESCLDSGRHERTVARDQQAALELGLRGTPSFVVNGQTLVGPVSFPYLQGLMDPMLENAN